MAYTLKRVDFINDRAYNEQEHATALFNGLPDFVQDGFDLTGTTITSGRAIVGGVPIKLGNTSETQTITPNFTGFLIIKVTLNSFNSNVQLIESASQQTSTNTIKYFTIYELVSGTIVQDYRHINYIKDLYFKDLGNDTFSLVINGFESAPFDVSVVQNAYSKAESDNRFLHKTGDNNIVNGATYSNGTVSTIYGNGAYAIKHVDAIDNQLIITNALTGLVSPSAENKLQIRDNSVLVIGDRLHHSTVSENNKYLIASDIGKTQYRIDELYSSTRSNSIEINNNGVDVGNYKLIGKKIMDNQEFNHFTKKVDENVTENIYSKNLKTKTLRNEDISLLSTTISLSVNTNDYLSLKFEGSSETLNGDVIIPLISGGTNYRGTGSSSFQGTDLDRVSINDLVFINNGTSVEILKWRFQQFKNAGEWADGANPYSASGALTVTKIYGMKLL